MTATTAVTMKRSVWFEDSTDAGREPIPAGLDEITPGPVLAALLSTIDVSTLSGYDRVTVLKAHQRMASHYSGAVLDGIAAIADEYEDTDLGFRGELDPLRGTSAEVRTALHLTRRAADDALALALHLRDRLPRVRTWLLRGDIDVLRARVIADGTEHLSPSAARRVVEALAERVHRLTTGQ
ncbi:MAG: DUF222 domain-containing protein, partial [Acidimicrobiia bacterium]|nr:DUF222 domain-containing protein [Acidimicrobiia bacterium]